MVTYLSNPASKVIVTHSGTATTFQNELFSAINVKRNENGYDVAQLTFGDPKAMHYSDITIGDLVEIDVSASVSGTWYTLLNGEISITKPSKSSKAETTLIQCDGAGSGFGKTCCNQEYGSQSITTLSNISSILTDSTYGLVPKYVNKVLASANNSGYSIGTTNVDSITDTIPYVSFPYKTSLQCMKDLCDIESALLGTDGIHWIVDTAGGLHVKKISGTQASWTHYYGDSQAAATLTEGVDFIDSPFEQQRKEANYIIYYGNWRRPSSGDSWTEGTASLWHTSKAHGVVSDDSTNHTVGIKSVKMMSDGTVNDYDLYYPSTKDLAMDFTKWGNIHVPVMSFYAFMHSSVGEVDAKLVTQPSTDSFYYRLDDKMSADAWTHFTLPIGPFYNVPDTYKSFVWSKSGSPSWSDIDEIVFDEYGSGSATSYFCIDGLYFGDAPVCRVAREKYPGEGGTLGTSANPLRTKLITDNVGKDDSLKDGNDSGLMAILAKAELYRSHSEPIITTIKVPMIADLLPGQLIHIHAKIKSDGTFAVDSDFRVKTVTQDIRVGKSSGYTSTLQVTSDVTNSNTRSAYDDINRIFSVYARPEFQDRQASSIKAQDVDSTLLRYECIY